MSAPIDFRRELPSHSLEPFALVKGACLYRDKTPAHSFVTVLVPILDSQLCLALATRDFFDEALAGSVAEFVSREWQSVNPERPISIIEGFHHAGYGLDSVAVLSPSCANFFEHENQRLSSLMFVVFPIFRCEFSGEETCDLVDLIRHDFVPTLNWRRHVSPQVYVRFRNAKSGTRSIGKKMGLSTMDFLLEQLHELPSNHNSFVEVKNYKEGRCRINRTDDGFCVTLVPLGETISLPANQIDSWVSIYLTKGANPHQT